MDKKDPIVARDISFNTHRKAPVYVYKLNSITKPFSINLPWRKLPIEINKTATLAQVRVEMSIMFTAVRT
jgi:hypothetical protein